MLKIWKILKIMNMILWMVMMVMRMEELLGPFHTSKHADTKLHILMAKLVLALIMFVHLRRGLLDHMDLGDLMEMMAHLVLLGHLDHLDLQDHQEIKESEDLKDHQENQDTQENITIIIVLEMVPKEREDHQVNLAFQDHLDPQGCVDLKVMLACLLMDAMGSTVILEYLVGMEKMDVLDYQESQD